MRTLQKNNIKQKQSLAPAKSVPHITLDPTNIPDLVLGLDEFDNVRVDPSLAGARRRHLEYSSSQLRLRLHSPSGSNNLNPTEAGLGCGGLGAAAGLRMRTLLGVSGLSSDVWYSLQG